MNNTFDVFKSRNLIEQCTHDDKVSKLLDGKVKFYIGFDPTADSLHVGHLVQIFFAKKLIEKGHECFLLIGGATAQIGDPTGRTSSRPSLSKDDLDKNVMAIESQLLSLLPEAKVVNNLDWFSTFSFLDFMKDIGSCFSVSHMLKSDCFKSRLDSGLSFLEFSYMLMQASDFLHLNNTFGVNLQIGGDDQWSNILAGMNLIHKKSGNESYGLTLPLLTNSNGEKIGKSFGNAIWLDKNKTSPFDFFQFWRNIPDADVSMCINSLTDINGLKEDINESKIELATFVTSFVHGEQIADQVKDQAKALFSKGEVFLDPVEISLGMNLFDVLIQVGFTKSKSEGRRLIEGKGVMVDNVVVSNVNLSFDKIGDFLICKGKKHFAKIRVS